MVNKPVFEKLAYPSFNNSEIVYCRSQQDRFGNVVCTIATLPICHKRVLLQAGQHTAKNR